MAVTPGVVTEDPCFSELLYIRSKSVGKFHLTERAVSELLICLVASDRPCFDLIWMGVNVELVCFFQWTIRKNGDARKKVSLIDWLLNWDGKMSTISTINKSECAVVITHSQFCTVMASTAWHDEVIMETINEQHHVGWMQTDAKLFGLPFFGRKCDCNRQRWPTCPLSGESLAQIFSRKVYSSGWVLFCTNKI